MENNYEKPDVEFIQLPQLEAVKSVVGGQTGMSGNIFN